MKFSELDVGDIFEFDRYGFEYSGMATGPWQKQTRGSYSYWNKPDVLIRVGSTKTKVIRIVSMRQHANGTPKGARTCYTFSRENLSGGKI